MNDDLMQVWVEEIWIKHTQAECKRLGFQRSMLTFDAFAAHLTDEVKKQLLESSTDTLTIPTGCTSKCQPMDVSLNKPFKAILRKCWIKYVADVVETFPERNTDSSFKLPLPTRQHMLNWVKEGFDYLLERQEMVKSSFEVCGISSSDPQKVRNGKFYKECMEKALGDLKDEDLDENEEDPFFM